jgi:hypothetical protein
MLSLKISLLSLSLCVCVCVGDQPLSFSSPLSLSPGRPFVFVCSSSFTSSSLNKGERERRSFVASSAESSFHSWISPVLSG